MQSWILFCDVFHDGIGDYIHFEDITKAIMANNALNNIQLTAVIRVDPDSKDSNKELIQKKLRDLKINFYYNQELNEPSLLQTLATADKAIIISRVSDFDKDYNKFLKKKPPIIYIGEHETATNRYNIGRSFSCRTLGLSDNFYGIKIPSIIKMNAEESWDTIHQSDINFASILDECTQCYSFNEFSQKVTLIPSYFNKPYDFLSFLSFLSTKLILSNEKKVVIYCSGVNMLDFFQDRIERQGDKFDAKKVNERFNQSDIRELEIVYARGESIIIPANSQGQQSITLLTGFYLTDSSYNAIYFLSTLAGVSGDNTLERCIAMDILPYYYSTNAHLKWPTLVALMRITQSPLLNIPPQARESFKMFFHPGKYVLSRTMRQDYYLNANPYDNHAVINLPAMIEAWPTVAGYLRLNCNFYNQLEVIVFSHTQPRTIERQREIILKELKPRLPDLIKSTADILSDFFNTSNRHFIIDSLDEGFINLLKNTIEFSSILGCLSPVQRKDLITKFLVKFSPEMAIDFNSFLHFFKILSSEQKEYVLNQLSVNDLSRLGFATYLHIFLEQLPTIEQKRNFINRLDAVITEKDLTRYQEVLSSISPELYTDYINIIDKKFLYELLGDADRIAALKSCLGQDGRFEAFISEVNKELEKNIDAEQMSKLSIIPIEPQQEIMRQAQNNFPLQSSFNTEQLQRIDDLITSLTTEMHTCLTNSSKQLKNYKISALQMLKDSSYRQDASSAIDEVNSLPNINSIRSGRSSRVANLLDELKTDTQTQSLRK